LIICYRNLYEYLNSEVAALVPANRHRHRHAEIGRAVHRLERLWLIGKWFSKLEKYDDFAIDDK
jgi:hypothetical protein